MALDNEGQWYRFHHLPGTFDHPTTKRYSEQEIAALHSRASAWYADNNLIKPPSAMRWQPEIRQLLRIWSKAIVTMNQEDWPRLVRWLEMLPRDLIDDRPLLMLETWRLQNRWRYADMPAHLARIEAKIKQAPLPEPDQTYLRDEIDLMYSRLCYYGGDAAKTLFPSKRALTGADGFTLLPELCADDGCQRVTVDIPGDARGLCFKEATVSRVLLFQRRCR